MRTKVEIKNLKCAGCESKIALHLHEHPNIGPVSVNTDNCMISFSYETEEGLESVKNTLSTLGYPLSKETTFLNGKRASSFDCPLKNK